MKWKGMSSQRVSTLALAELEKEGSKLMWGPENSRMRGWAPRALHVAVHLSFLLPFLHFSRGKARLDFLARNF